VVAVVAPLLLPLLLGLPMKPVLPKELRWQERSVAGTLEPAPPPRPPVPPILETVTPAPGSAATELGAATGLTRTVEATAYCLQGTTASGSTVGPGTIATDPSYIPLGTRMYVPGYGEGVALDTGGSINGAHIDLWMASCDAAIQWGVRTVTINVGQ
jgi:3D (Asp-Asp-Asp) domain-containing protein